MAGLSEEGPPKVDTEEVRWPAPLGNWVHGLAFTVDAVTDAFKYHVKEVDRRDKEINIEFLSGEVACIANPLPLPRR